MKQEGGKKQPLEVTLIGRAPEVLLYEKDGKTALIVAKEKPFIQPIKINGLVKTRETGRTMPTDRITAETGGLAEQTENAAATKVEQAVVGKTNETVITPQPEVEKPKWQIKDEEWTRRWNMAFSEKPASEVDKPKPEPEVETEGPIVNASASKRPGPDVLPGTRTQARINDAAKEPKLKVKSVDSVKKTEKKAATEETEAGKQEQLSRLARLLQDYNEQQKLKQKYEEKWFNEELAAEEKAKANTAKLLAEADAKVAAQKAEADGKIATAREEGKESLWKEIKRPRGIKEKFKILFSRHREPKTDEQKVAQYKRDIYRTVVLAGVGGALAMLGTWGVAQYFGFFLPTPIKELTIHTKEIINR